MQILLTFLIYSIDALASIRQNLTTLDNSTDLDYGNQSTNRDILIEIEILPRAWRWKIDAYGNLHHLRVLSIIQFILPTSLIIPPVLGITSLWREVEKPEHYKLETNFRSGINNHFLNLNFECVITSQTEMISHKFGDASQHCRLIRSRQVKVVLL